MKISRDVAGDMAPNLSQTQPAPASAFSLPLRIGRGHNRMSPDSALRKVYLGTVADSPSHFLLAQVITKTDVPHHLLVLGQIVRLQRPEDKEM